jgi:hypothetical protein
LGTKNKGCRLAALCFWSKIASISAAWARRIAGHTSIARKATIRIGDAIATTNGLIQGDAEAGVADQVWVDAIALADALGVAMRKVRGKRAGGNLDRIAVVANGHAVIVGLVIGLHLLVGKDCDKQGKAQDEARKQILLHNSIVVDSESNIANSTKNS